MCTYGPILLSLCLGISKSGVCCKKGNAISLVVQSRSPPVSTSTTKNRCMAQYYTTITRGGYPSGHRYDIKILCITTIKSMTNGKSTIIIEKYSGLLCKTANIQSNTTIKQLIEDVYTTNNGIQYFGTAESI